MAYSNVSVYEKKKLTNPYAQSSAFAKQLHTRKGLNNQKLKDTQLSFRSGYNKAISDVIEFNNNISTTWKPKANNNNYVGRNYSKAEINKTMSSLGEVKIK